MRTLLASLSLSLAIGISATAHAESFKSAANPGDTTTTYTFTGTLNNFNSSGSPSYEGAQVGTVSGSVVFDNTTDTFTSEDLTYIYNGVPTTFDGPSGATYYSYNGATFTYTIFGNNGAYFEINPTNGSICTLSSLCPGVNASNLEQGTIPNIGSLTSVSTLVTNPTPEPSSLILLGTGILGVAGAARRRFVKA